MYNKLEYRVTMEKQFLLFNDKLYYIFINMWKGTNI